MTEVELRLFAEQKLNFYLDPNADKGAMLARLYAFCTQVDE
jgi:hypothetical protein